MTKSDSPSIDLDEKLGIFELRERFLEHTRHAYGLLPPFESNPPRILDIGCGAGQPSLDLARLSGGEVVGIDVDAAALDTMRRRIAEADLGHRVTAMHTSLQDTDFPPATFDLAWEEGVLHLVDPAESLPRCHHLLAPRGHLVMHETIEWFTAVRPRLAGFGFTHAQTYLLPEGCWVTDYAAPLEERIRAFERAHAAADLDAATARALARHESDAASIRADPTHQDCGFYILQKQA